MPGRGHLGRVACPLNRDDRRATAALGDGCPTRSNLSRSVEAQHVGRSPEYSRGNPTENPVGKTEVVLQLAGPAGGRLKHSVVVSKSRGGSTVQSLRSLPAPTPTPTPTPTPMPNQRHRHRQRQTPTPTPISPRTLFIWVHFSTYMHVGTKSCHFSPRAELRRCGTWLGAARAARAS